MREDHLTDFLAPIPGVPAGRRVHDMPAQWLDGRDSEAIVAAMPVLDEAPDGNASFPTKLVQRPMRKYTPANRNKSNVYYVFVHSSEGSYHGAIDWLINGPVSASYCLIINEAGTEATQLVASKDIAWAGGTSYSNTYGVHICLAGYAARGFSDGAMKAGAAWAKYFADQYEVPVQFAFDINASTRRQLLRAGIAGHEHIPGANHTDPFGDSQPGHKNNWTRFLNLMKGSSAPKPTPAPTPTPTPEEWRLVLDGVHEDGKQVGRYREYRNVVAMKKLLTETFGLKVREEPVPKA